MPSRPRRLIISSATRRGTQLGGALLAALLCLAAGGALAQAAPPPQDGAPGAGEPVTANQPLLRDPRLVGNAKAPPRDVECVVGAGSPCAGRMDFNDGRSFGFKISGPGEALFRNIGNRRCTLEYILTDSTVATAGRTMDLAAGAATTLKVRDAQGMHVRLSARGMASPICELEVTAKQS
ncbi:MULTISPECIES: hypothetical protein [Nitrospirillum]|uniref:DUF3617 family protein n=1 Tax=Nitrospirillum amazonense TaxID=28077 RepID=A0A560EWL1_9PROT|nr:hypothetical protein [Nitrospirillum amazonense]MEC4594515.1 hypothetical protein [Nitrospirillum amazonense]TWB13770.1 hypothetical protein FBZ88_13522 [Nitrospirillum amazonense]